MMTFLEKSTPNRAENLLLNEHSVILGNILYISMKSLPLRREMRNIEYNKELQDSRRKSDDIFSHAFLAASCEIYFVAALATTSTSSSTAVVEYTFARAECDLTSSVSTHRLYLAPRTFPQKKHGVGVYKGERISARISTAVKPRRAPRERKGRGREPLRVHNGAHMFAGVYNVPRSIGTSIDLLALVAFLRSSNARFFTQLNFARVDLVKKIESSSE